MPVWVIAIIKMVLEVAVEQFVKLFAGPDKVVKEVDPVLHADPVDNDDLLRQYGRV